jgi:putative membrane protein
MADRSTPDSLPRSVPLTKALLAGLAGGLAGSAAKVVGEKLLPPRTLGQPPPPKLVVEQASAAADVHLPPPAKKAATEGIHWVFGTLTGGVYGVVAEFQPHATAWRGAAFGLTLNRLMHEGVLPGAGLVEPVGEQPAQERVNEWVTHVMYGVVTETVRRVMRKRL